MHVRIFTKKNLIGLLSLMLVCTSHAQTADFTFNSPDSVYCDPYAMTFTQNCTGTPLGFIWDFGNGQRGAAYAERIFYTAGTYNVTLTALYATTAISVTKTITIHPTPLISLEADKNNLCKPGVVSFTAAGSAFISNYEWNFGEGTTTQNTTTGNATYSYRNYGTYTASVKANTAAGCSGIATYDINVSKFGITATISADSGCIPVRSTLNVSTILPAGDRPLNYTWTFGDGAVMNRVTDSSVSHLYNTTDSISNANVVINSIDGCTNTVSFTPFAFGTPPYNTNAGTVMQLDTFCGSETIKFYCRSVNANLYQWSFGDSAKTSVNDTIAAHKYRSLGRKQIIVTPFFNGCQGTSDTFYVFIKGVIADFTYGNDCSNKTNYHFTNMSLGNISAFNWTFSDNLTRRDSVSFNPTNVFPVYGTFKTTLSLFDSTTGCSDELSYNIYTAVPVLTSNTNKVCRDSLLQYSISNTYADSAGYTYEFFISGDSLSNAGDSILNYHPNKHGSFADYVVIKDAVEGTCNDTLRLGTNTIVRGPDVNFTSPDRLCVEKPFLFTNSSQPFFASEPVTEWRWEYGDHRTDSVKHPLPHLYANPSGYDVKLTATDINGCGDTLMKTILAAPMPYLVAFPAADTICGQRDTALLTGYTLDSLRWLPATNISCTSCDSTKVYPFVTTSYVAQASNRFGCISYDTCVIKVFGPLNIKISPADTAICPGSNVQYRVNTTDGIVSWLPAAGLNSTTIKNPVATPAVDASYTVIVKDSAGCYTDTAVAAVHVLALPAVNAGEDKIVSFNNSFNITPVYSPEVVSYSWEPSLNLNCSNCPAPSGTAVQNTTYTIKTTSANGCTASDKINIIIACENGNLLLPTAFSPNGNGVNEYFYPIARGYKSIKKFVIFNRQGFKVFERQNFAPNSPAQGWDGIIKGASNVSSSETFAWYIEAECQQGELVTNKGTVVLVR